MRPIQIVFSDDRCSCGALLESNARRCRKCRNRARWLRRKSSAATLPRSRTQIPGFQAHKGGDEH